MTKKRFILLLLLLLLLAGGGVLAQVYSGRSGGYDPGFGRSARVGRGGGRSNQTYPSQGRTGRGGRGGRGVPNPEFLSSNQSLFTWDIDPEFSQDVFTFVRIRYDTGYRSYGYGGRGGRGRGMGGGGPWNTDYPDSDNNFSYRLHQVTSIQVNPQPVVMDITNPDLFNYPFIYIVEPGNLYLRDDEVPILRKYLLNGGFLMLDDFWGPEQWYNVYTEMKRVFPELEPTPLTLDHPIFHCVFDIKKFPQIPAYNLAVNLSTDTLTGVTSESGDPPIYYGIFDDKGRMMVIIDRDTDLGDGWEREGMSHAFFSEFSEKQAYPLGINIIFYVMTH